MFGVILFSFLFSGCKYPEVPPAPESKPSEVEQQSNEQIINRFLISHHIARQRAHNEYIITHLMNRAPSMHNSQSSE